MPHNFPYNSHVYKVKTRKETDTSLRSDNFNTVLTIFILKDKR